MVKKPLSENCLIELQKNATYFIPDNTSIKIVVITKNSDEFKSLHLEIGSEVNLELLIVTKNLFKVNINIKMNGLNSKVLVNNLGILNLEDTSIKNIVIKHSGNHNFSRIESFNLLEGNSSLEEFANVIIMKKTIFSDTYLKQRAILLDEKSKAKLMPTLEINNCETKAGHGSVQGYFNEDLIFYLMSRGLNHTQAIDLLINSQIIPLVSNFEDLWKYE